MGAGVFRASSSSPDGTDKRRKQQFIKEKETRKTCLSKELLQRERTLVV